VDGRVGRGDEEEDSGVVEAPQYCSRGAAGIEQMEYAAHRQREHHTHDVYDERNDAQRTSVAPRNQHPTQYREHAGADQMRDRTDRFAETDDRQRGCHAGTVPVPASASRWSLHR
jgi:hypothetical protein